VTLRRLMPADVDATALADLVADAAAIPAAAFSVSRSAAKRVINLAVPAQRVVVELPAATISLLEAAEEHIATLSR
jgi:hypothetical protein